MERFPDGAHIVLKNKVRGTYLHADKDIAGVSLSPLRDSVNSAWRVHQVVRGATTFIFLHSASSGRYLAPCRRADRHAVPIQSNKSPPDEVLLWRLHLDGGFCVRLRHAKTGLLRASSKNGLKVDSNSKHNLMEWRVEIVPTIPEWPVFDMPCLKPRGLFHRIFDVLKNWGSRSMDLPPPHSPSVVQCSTSVNDRATSFPLTQKPCPLPDLPPPPIKTIQVGEHVISTDHQSLYHDYYMRSLNVHTGFILCHFCVFEYKCHDYCVVKICEINHHCNTFHGTFGLCCKSKNCLVKFRTIEEVDLHFNYCHGSGRLIHPNVDAP